MRYLFLIAAILLSAPASAQERGPTVVELFTSQSCSSCPPADKYIDELAQDKDLLVLSCHVTYWNHLSWRDTLSLEECTEQQREFSMMNNVGRVYTPQIIVNGEYEGVGSRKKEIGGYIKKAKKKNDVLPIELSLKDVSLTITMPEKGRLKQPVDVRLLAYDESVTEHMERGENWNKTIKYTHPIRHHVPLDKWDGHAKTEDVFVTHMPVNGGYAVIAREYGSGKVLAAGSVKAPDQSERERGPKVSPSRGFQLKSDNP